MIYNFDYIRVFDADLLTTGWLRAVQHIKGLTDDYTVTYSGRTYTLYKPLINVVLNPISGAYVSYDYATASETFGNAVVTNALGQTTSLTHHGVVIPATSAKVINFYTYPIGTYAVTPNKFYCASRRVDGAYTVVYATYADLSYVYLASGNFNALPYPTIVNPPQTDAQTFVAFSGVTCNSTRVSAQLGICNYSTHLHLGRNTDYYYALKAVMLNPEYSATTGYTCYFLLS